MSELLPFDAVVPLQRALASREVEVGTWALVEACANDFSLESFARCARRLGLDANVVRLAPGDLRFLAEGSVVTLEGEGVAMVLEQTPSGTVVELPNGTRRTVLATARASAALELGRPDPAGHGLVERLVTSLRADPRALRAVALSAAIGVLLLLLGLAGPMLTRTAMGEALPDRADSTLRLVAIATALLGLHVAALGWVRRRALRYLSAKLAERASLAVTGHMLHLPYAKLRTKDIGAVTQAVGSAQSAAETSLVLGPQLVDAAVGVGYLLYIASLDRTAFAVAGSAGTLMVLTGWLAGRHRLSRQRTMLTKQRAAQQAAYETLAGIETVKAEAAQGRMLARWLDRVVAQEKVALETQQYGAFAGAFFTTIQTSVGGAMLLVLAQRCLAGTATVADLVAVAQATASFLASAQSAAQLPAAFAAFRSDVERADAMLAEDAESRTGGRRPADPHAPALVLRDLWFRYDAQSPWVLSGLDLVVRAGEMVLLAWPSGAGKSTLLRVLAGLLPASRGDAMIHGMDATEARRLVTYIPQQTALLPGSLMENLRLLSREASPQRILAAAQLTGLLDLVSTWGMGLETVVSLGGSNLSSGQRQLVLLTAAVASQTPIVLLDEALAHMDLSMRARLDVGRLFPNRTLVVVAHDASAREIAGARVVGMPGALVPSRAA